MERDRAVEVVTNLADGIDPYTKENICDSSPYQNADTVRALHIALDALKGCKVSKTVREEGKGKVGKAWTDEDEKKMAEMFDAKVAVVEIAEKLERTKGGIWARLEKIGRVTRDENGKIAVTPGARPSAPVQDTAAPREQQPVPAGCEF